MRIGVVTTSYPRSAGDPAGSFVAEHAAWLARSGCEVEVIAAGEPTAFDTSGDVRVTRIRDGRLFYRGGAPEALESSALAWVRAAAFQARLAAAVARRSARWDAVVAHWLVPSAVAARVGARRVPLLAIAHSGDVHVLRSARLATPVAALLASRAARTVFVSRDVRARFADALPAPLRARFAGAPVCSMGVDVDRFRRARAAAPASSGSVVFLGRLVPVKGIDTLLGAAQLRTDLRFVIAGDGPERARIARTLRARGLRNVRMVGEVRGAARDELLAGAGVVVLPSVELDNQRTEGFPVSVLESMAAGAPVIASAVGGINELPAASVTRVPPGDARALAHAVGALLEDRSLRASQIGAASAFVDQRDWSVVGPTLMRHIALARS